MDFEAYSRFVREGRHLLEGSDGAGRAHIAFNHWVDGVAEWLEEQFPRSPVAAEWSSLGASNLIVGDYEGGSAAWPNFRTTVNQRLAWLSKLARSVAMLNDAPKGGKPSSPSGRIFVVHGRNNALRESVARFLEKIRLTPIILHEQPNRGRTIIEKFVDYSDVGFAIVLMTGDDLGAFRDSPEATRPRPRQKVVLELGFFLGRLGRERVAVLYEEGVEIPSDYEGVVFTPIDPGGAWRFLIAREMRSAVVPLDLNDLQ